MNQPQAPARILLGSGLKLRELRRCLQARAIELADRELAGAFPARPAKPTLIERGRVLGMHPDAFADMVRTARDRSHKLRDPKYVRASAALVDELVKETGLNYRKLQAAFDRELTKAAMEVSREKGLRRPMDKGAGAAARMLGVHRNWIPKMLARTEVRKAEVS